MKRAQEENPAFFEGDIDEDNKKIDQCNRKVEKYNKKVDDD